jgi:hypothetical protein
MTPSQVLRIDLERLESIKVDSNRVKWTKFTQNTLKMIRKTRGMQNNDLPIDWSDIEGDEWC